MTIWFCKRTEGEAKLEHCSSSTCTLLRFSSCLLASPELRVVFSVLLALSFVCPSRSRLRLPFPRPLSFLNSAGTLSGGCVGLGIHSVILTRCVVVFCRVLLFVAFLFHFFVHFCPSMAPKFDALRSVVPHREAYRLLVRIDRLWVVPGFINPDEAMAIEMVFLDQHLLNKQFLVLSGKIECTLFGDFAHQIKSFVQSGNIPLLFKDSLDGGVPTELDALVGKKLLFKITKKASRFSTFGDTYRVAGVCDDARIISMYELNGADSSPLKASLHSSAGSVINLAEEELPLEDDAKKDFVSGLLVDFSGGSDPIPSDAIESSSCKRRLEADYDGDNCGAGKSIRLADVEEKKNVRT
ncbi:hypothetical protein RIF29_00517 [Crotalaria pallida]|uniref:Uncharacterized protein n=1 Tax=Crotalaria pallida TaxID=3830 RepID=A0AAN9P726_CROPI